MFVIMTALAMFYYCDAIKVFFKVVKVSAYKRFFIEPLSESWQ